MVETDSNDYVKFSKKIKIKPTRRQDAPKVYQLNGLFVYDTKQFMKYKNQYPPKGMMFEIPSETGLMIDTELEFRTAEIMIKDKLI